MPKTHTVPTAMTVISMSVLTAVSATALAIGAATVTGSESTVADLTPMAMMS